MLQSYRVIALAAFAALAGCTQPVVLTPCREARELRAEAKAEADGFKRGLIEAKAAAAQDRCQQEANSNAEHGYQSEKRRHQAEVIERGD